MIFLEAKEEGGVVSLVFTAGFCKDCGRKIIDGDYCSGMVCQECTEKCQHTYEPGLVCGDSGRFEEGGVCSHCKKRVSFDELSLEEAMRLFVAREKEKDNGSIDLNIVYARGPKETVRALVDFLERHS